MTRPGGASVARRFCSVGCTARGAWGERPAGGEGLAEGEGGRGEGARARARARGARSSGHAVSQGAAAVRENVCCRRGQPALLGWALDSARSLGPGPARLVISAQSRGAAGCAPSVQGKSRCGGCGERGVRARAKKLLPPTSASTLSPVTCRAAARAPHRPHPVGRHQHHRPWSRASTRGTA